MNYLKYDLGDLSSGDVVEVSLTRAANVKLMNSTNFSSYRNGRKHSYYGGLVKRSPCQLQVPNSGIWHVAIDMHGLSGSTNASVRVL